jgi:hypothetical protein
MQKELFRQKRKLYRINSFFLLTLLIVCCNTKKNSKERFHYIEITYYIHDLETPVAIGCANFFSYKINDFMGKNYVDTTINEKEITDRIFECVDNLKLDSISETKIDVRLKCLLHNRENNVDTLCLGAFGEIILNDKQMKNDSVLIHLIKANSGWGR